MIRPIRFLIIPFLFILAFFAQSNAQTDIMNCDHSKEFARYLFFTQQYDLARHELERINFLCDFDSTSNLMLLQSFRKLKLYSNENLFFEKLMVNGTLNNQRLDYRDEYVRLLMLQGRYGDVVQQIEKGLVFNQKIEHHLGALLLQQKWTEAGILVDQGIPYENMKVNMLKDIARNSMQSKRKKPWLAGALSVLLPGSGKAYSGYWGDGAISLTFTASTTFMAVRAFNRYGSKNVYSWITGGLAASYYLANIYGGQQSAIRYNTNLEHKFVHETEQILFTDY